MSLGAESSCPLVQFPPQIFFVVRFVRFLHIRKVIAVFPKAEIVKNAFYVANLKKLVTTLCWTFILNFILLYIISLFFAQALRGIVHLTHLASAGLLAHWLDDGDVGGGSCLHPEG